jgi:peptide/nickel transport system ATP-binding protein
VNSVLEVRGLTVAYGATVVVEDVDLNLEQGRILGVAGESGCGKSTAALAAIGFRIPGSVRLAGTSTFGAVDLLSAPTAMLRRIWGREISYVAQNAAAALNPLLRVERLLAEPLSLHLRLAGEPLRRRSLELLESVGLPDPELALRRYPHQFSGGQQQRVALAIAMACEPRVLVLDEPTTGLDVTTQAQISKLIDRLVRESGTSALSISHDLVLLATVCDEIAIMYAGEIVERAAAAEVYGATRHPYAAALIDAVPTIDEDTAVVGIPGLPPPQVINDRCAFSDRCRFVIERCRVQHPQLLSVSPRHDARCLRAAELGVLHSQRRRPLTRGAAAEGALLTVRDLRCTYRDNVAVDGISFAIALGETLALVGESGSGKTTVLRAIAGLHTPESGEIVFEGAPLPARAVRRRRELRRSIQIVFQNPDSSLNPRHTIGTILDRPLALFRPDQHRAARRKRALELLADVRLDASVLSKYPHQLSGGQKQRVALARAFAAEPKLILCDEVVSALDVSVQASILELLGRLAVEHATALLFVTHDLAVVRSIADRVCVLRGGTVRETGPTALLFSTPANDYTRELLAAVPRP